MRTANGMPRRHCLRSTPLPHEVPGPYKVLAVPRHRKLRNLVRYEFASCVCVALKPGNKNVWQEMPLGGYVNTGKAKQTAMFHMTGTCHYLDIRTASMSDRDCLDAVTGWRAFVAPPLDKPELIPSLQSSWRSVSSYSSGLPHRLLKKNCKSRRKLH